MAVCQQEGCDNAPMHGFDFCYFHEPTFATQRAESRSQGGKAARKVLARDDIADLDLQSLADLNKLLADLVGHVVTGKISARTAKAAGYLVRSVSMVHQVSLLVGRIAAIEKRLEAMKHGA